MFDWQTLSEPLLILAAGFVAGAVNSLAGGGTIVSFPTLVAFGLSPLTANATSMVALWPGTLGGSFGFRKEIRDSPTGWRWMFIPAIVGGLTGAFLLRELPTAIFESLAHWLLLGASIMIGFEPLIRKRALSGAKPRPGARAGGAVALTLIAVYGGYFGAGIGILLLPVIALAGASNIHTANGIKNLFMIGNKGVAAAYLIIGGLVSWRHVLPMAAGAIAGGWVAATLGRRVPDRPMRIAIVVLGLAIFIWLVSKG